VFDRLRQLLRHLVVYGIGDAAASLVSFLLLPIYTRYLSPSDYGVITMLLTVEAVTRILFRWGTDSAFMRLYYDCESDADRQVLASTLMLFLIGANGALLALGFLITPALGRFMFGVSGQDGLVRLVLVNTFLMTLHALPNSLLRIRERSRLFSALTFAKSAGTIVIRLVLVVLLRQGVWGVVLADTVIAVIFTGIMARWMLPLLRLSFSGAVLREALRYGMPRLPHALAHQAIAVSDRYLLAAFVPLREIGLYGIGSSFGQALKLFLNGFEFAWAPFYMSSMSQPDAKSLFSRLGTYLFAAVVLLAAGLSAVAPELVRLMTAAEFAQAAAVIPWVTVGVVAQASYQVASLGLNITKQTKYFPAATGLSAVVSIAANLALIPRFGFVGAAAATALSYSVLTLLIGVFAYRVYPVHYEWRRLGLVAADGLLCYMIASILVPAFPSAMLGLTVRGTLVVVLYPTVLWIAGFLDVSEWEGLKGIMTTRGSAARPPLEADSPVEMVGEIVSETVDVEREWMPTDAGRESRTLPQRISRLK